MNKYVIAIIGVGVFIGGIVYLLYAYKNTSVNKDSYRQTQSSQSTIKPMTIQKPLLQIDFKKTYTAVVKTSNGEITIELAASKTPNTVNNFVYLARQHFYDNTIFHRVISGFMIQGGDPNGNGSGGPGYRFDDEPFDGEYVRGTVAMANAGPNTNGSQFFIMHKDYDLPKNYVIFGHVTKGMDVVDTIATAPVIVKNGERSSPIDPIVVQSVNIIEK